MLCRRLQQKRNPGFEGNMKKLTNVAIDFFERVTIDAMQMASATEEKS
jgi:hypothetical protein